MSNWFNEARFGMFIHWGVRLRDIELRRNDEAFLDGLGEQRIPDPTPTSR